jgi:anaerobic glycerol-3-phosphate dehydrogenase
MPNQNLSELTVAELVTLHEMAHAGLQRPEGPPQATQQQKQAVHDKIRRDLNAAQLVQREEERQKRQAEVASSAAEDGFVVCPTCQGKGRVAQDPELTTV